MKTKPNCKYLIDEFKAIEKDLKQFLEAETLILELISALSNVNEKSSNGFGTRNIIKIRSMLLLKPDIFKESTDIAGMGEAWKLFWKNINEYDKAFIIRVLKLKKLSKIMEWVDVD
jgi:hypothetical protein